jgi:hypothetical protein
MKIKALIQLLQTLDSEMEIMRHGYEGGVDSVTQVVVKRVALDVHLEEWYYGNHEVIYKDDAYPGKKVISAAVIS